MRAVAVTGARALFLFQAMDFALSTNWNSFRCEDGGEIVDEALALGFDSLELSYRLTAEQLDGIRRRVDAGDIRVGSVHAPCPLPSPDASPTPEPFSLTALDERERRQACALAVGTLNAAVDFGARVVVVHAGHVTMGGLTERIARVRRSEREPGLIQGFLIKRLMRQRREKAADHLDSLRRSLSEILPMFERAKIALALENLPYWEGMPSETEMEALLREFKSPVLKYWHDIGHGQVRENLGVGSHLAWVQRLLPATAGCHIHDVIGLDGDHRAPGQGGIDFSEFSALAAPSIVHVFEPSPMVDRDALAEGFALVRRAW